MASRLWIEGEAGKIEILVDQPEQIRAIAVVTHPHPLMGGNAEHKIPKLLAEFFVCQGCLVYRPQFRGVDGSEGVHDHGIGETRDIIKVIQSISDRYPQLPLYVGGFSFGSYVITHCLKQLPSSITDRVRQVVLTGLPCGLVRDQIDYDPAAVQLPVLLIHGEKDDIASLSHLIEWAQPQKLPITILPGANHFFTGYLNIIKQMLSQSFIKP